MTASPFWSLWTCRPSRRPSRWPGAQASNPPDPAPWASSAPSPARASLHRCVDPRAPTTLSVPDTPEQSAPPRAPTVLGADLSRELGFPCAILHATGCLFPAYQTRITHDYQPHDLPSQRSR